MTEEQAKKRWCPMVRFQIGPINSSVWQGVAYTNRAEELKSTTCLCIASDCMMWVETDRVPIEPELTHYEPAGHCGLVR